jgi:hypothetical protein
MNAVENYIANCDGEGALILSFLHELIIEKGDLTPKLKYGIPFYYRKSWICYLNPLKNGGVELAFPRGNELSNIQGLLMDKGRKQVFGIELHSIETTPIDSIIELINEAILLDETIPYSSKRSMKRK